MGKALTPEEKEKIKEEKKQEKKALKSFYELIRRAHSKGALVDVTLPEGETLEDILSGKIK
jgi:D-alanyl-D-alanine dipeptidase